MRLFKFESRKVRELKDTIAEMKKKIHPIILIIAVIAVIILTDRAIINSNIPDWWKFVLLR